MDIFQFLSWTLFLIKWSVPTFCVFGVWQPRLAWQGILWLKTLLFDDGASKRIRIVPADARTTLRELVSRFGQRALWSHIPEVVDSEAFPTLTSLEKERQEALFEVLTSEQSFLHAVNVFLRLFHDNAQLGRLLTNQEKEYLFGNIVQIRNSSEALLEDLLTIWQKSWYVDTIAPLLEKHVCHGLVAYSTYCRNKVYQDKILQHLVKSRNGFLDTILSLEKDRDCQGWKMDSFLVLPMQRVTKYPLLVTAVLKRTESATDKVQYQLVVEMLTSLVAACNEAARDSQDFVDLVNRLELPKHAKSPLPQVPKLAEVLLQGKFWWYDVVDTGPGLKGLGGQRSSWALRSGRMKESPHFLFLLPTLLLVCKNRKSTGKLKVVDMAAPSDFQVKAIMLNLPRLRPCDDYAHLFVLHRKDRTFVFGAKTPEEVERWRHKLDRLNASVL